MVGVRLIPRNRCLCDKDCERATDDLQGNGFEEYS